MELIADNDITVTSATQTEEAVAAHFGEKPVEKPAAEAKPVATDKVPADKGTPAPKKDGDAPAGDKVVEAEADSDKPNEQVSEAARTLRRSRFDARKKEKQTEIDGLTRTAGDLRREVEELERRREAAARQPAAADRKPDAATKPAAAAAPEFKFPTFEEWQEKPENEAKSFADYTDARTDARYEFNERKSADRVQRDQREQSQREQAQAFQGFEKTFRETHPEYDDALDKVQLSNEQLASPQFKDIQRFVAKSGELGPAILFHFAQHPDVAPRLLASRFREDLIADLGAIRHQLKAAATAAPKPADDAGTKPPPRAPSKPVSEAPAPVETVSGNATSGRSLHAIAEDDDDADAYITARGQGHLLKR